MRCTGGFAITTFAGLVTAASTGWPPLPGPDRVRTVLPVHTDPPPFPGVGARLVAHLHLNRVAVDAIHRAADWGGLLAVTVHGDQATFTLTRPTQGGHHE